MPIHPKHVFGKAQPAAPGQFIGRNDLIALFERALAVPGQDVRPVIIFYGIGGIGKTSLRRRLVGLADSRPDTILVVLDFQVSDYRTPETALFALRRMLGKEHKVKFPTFDIAYTVFWKKAHPGSKLKEQESVLLETSDDIAQIVGSLGVTSVVQLVPKLAIAVNKGSGYLREWWLRRGSQELKDLPELESAQIAERLPMFWAADLKDHLTQHSASAVVFIDAYETLGEGAGAGVRGQGSGGVAERDEWVREWAAHLPDVLWVICGRERLQWADAEPEWNQRLDQHLVSGLTDDEVEQFLVAAGVGDSDVRDAISEASLGVPLYLELALETWRNIRLGQEREPVAADFDQKPQELFSRFVGHLPRNEIEALKVLAITRFWTSSLAEQLMVEFRTGFSIAALHGLPQLPFISPGPLSDTWTMNRLVRACLDDRTPGEFRVRVHRFLFDFYALKLERMRAQAVTDDSWQLLTEASHHAQHALKSREFASWVLTATEPFGADETRMLLVPLYQQVIKVIEAGPEPEPAALAQLRERMARLMA
jgi:hypothetical protein